MQNDERDWGLECRIAWLRLCLAFIALHYLKIRAGFRQDQPRDSGGRWSEGGGSFVVTRKDKTGDPKIDAKTDQILDVLKEIVESISPGQGALYRIAVHSKAAARMRELDLPGIGRHGIEQSFSAGDTVRDGLDGSVRTDFIARDGRTADAPVRAIWDLKTGRARLTGKRAAELEPALASMAALLSSKFISVVASQSKTTFFTIMDWRRHDQDYGSLRFVRAAPIRRVGMAGRHSGDRLRSDTAVRRGATG